MVKTERLIKQSHQDPPWDRGPICEVYRLISITLVAFTPKICEILSYAYSTHSQLTRAFSTRHITRGHQKIMPRTENHQKEYGPVSVHQHCYITREQQELIHNQMQGLWPEIGCKYEWGHLVGPTYTRQCKACFGQSTTMSVCSSRDSPSHEV